MLADEDWSSDDDGHVEGESSLIMTYDEFTKKATEIIEQVNIEIAETKEIMNASPGRDAEFDARKKESSLSSASLPIRRTVMKDQEPLYE